MTMLVLSNDDKEDDNKEDEERRTVGRVRAVFDVVLSNRR